jgi:hypothetical protein
MCSDCCRTVAFKQAALNCIAYLEKLGYSESCCLGVSAIEMLMYHQSS